MTKEKHVDTKPITIGIVLFDDAEELDWAGPYEVFGMATREIENARVVTIAERQEALTGFNGLRVLPDHDFSNAPNLDVVLVPGGQGTRKEFHNPAMLNWLAGVAPACQWVTSVCTGALLLHGAGITDHRRVTTHWAFIDQLREHAPKATVLENVRYVRDGNLVTAAGVSAGIDMSLWLVGQIWNVDRARSTQRFMEYDPAPPYAAQT